MGTTKDMVRTPIKVRRKPITVASDMGFSLGGWFAFPMPDEEPPNWRLRSNQRILWCPWCGDWSIYKKSGQDTRWHCTGYCGWGNTDEFYVRTRNKIWFEDVPLGELKKLNIPAPSKGRR